MATKPEIMSAYLGRVVAGDLEGAAEHYTDDIVFHWAGRGPLSGDYTGKAAVLDMFADYAKRVRSSVEPHDQLYSDDHAVVLARGTYTKGDRVRSRRTASSSTTSMATRSPRSGSWTPISRRSTSSWPDRPAHRLRAPVGAPHASEAHHDSPIVLSSPDVSESHEVEPLRAPVSRRPGPPKKLG